MNGGSETSRYKSAPDQHASPLPPVKKINIYFETQRLLDIPVLSIAKTADPDSFDTPRSEAPAIMQNQAYELMTQLSL